MTQTISYLGLKFVTADRDRLRETILDLATCGQYHYVVTPNVDHIVSLRSSSDTEMHAAYDGASIRLCDSRIIAALGGLSGRSLTAYPGSDLTHDLIENRSANDLRLAAIGPSETALSALARRFPVTNLVHIPSQMNLVPGTAPWKATVERARDERWDILFVCLSFPKQERFAYDLGHAGRDSGVALCVGASFDFLSGAQKRAPRMMQRLGLEWLYRLLSEPRRLWRRYLLRGPTIFALVLRQVLDDIGSRSTRHE